MRNPLMIKNSRFSGVLFLVLAAVAIQAFPAVGAGGDGIQFWVDRFAIDGNAPVSGEAVDAVLSGFTDRHLTFADLEAAAGALEKAFQEAGFPFYKVGVPPQRIVDGEVRLRVISFPLRDIRVEGNQNFGVENILRSLPPLIIGESPNTLDVAQALQFANEHPSKRAAVFVKQQEGGDGIAARVEVRDTRPYQIFASINDTGTTNPGRTRTAVGLQHSNLFDRDHILTATYTTSPENVDDVSQYGADYRLPIYSLSTEVGAFYTYSEIDQGTVGGFFDVSGRGQFFGISATHTLAPIEAYSHKAAIGYQDRFFDNETRFGGALVTPDADVRSTPLSFRYSGSYAPKNLTIDGYLAWEFNTGIGDYNKQLNYTANRADASDEWDKLTGGLSFKQTLTSDFQVRGRVNGQFSNQALIPGEQFGLGGSRSVRGYEEREVSGDYGIQGSIEAWSPSLFFGSRLVAFADAGEVRVFLPQDAGTEHLSVSSVGAGLRWNWKGYVDITLDAAYAFNDAVTTEAGDARLLYQVFLRY